eukprot:scaffold12646_cov146-Skeletonema_dohrnii-CCMP3373.AAC.7
MEQWQKRESDEALALDHRRQPWTLSLSSSGLCRKGLLDGYVSKEDFVVALRAHQAAVDAASKSPQRQSEAAGALKIAHAFERGIQRSAACLGLVSDCFRTVTLSDSVLLQNTITQSPPTHRFGGGRSQIVGFRLLFYHCTIGKV